MLVSVGSCGTIGPTARFTREREKMTRDVLWNVPSQVERFVAIYYNKYFAICIQFCALFLIPGRLLEVKDRATSCPLNNLLEGNS